MRAVCERRCEKALNELRRDRVRSGEMRRDPVRSGEIRRDWVRSGEIRRTCEKMRTLWPSRRSFGSSLCIRTILPATCHHGEYGEEGMPRVTTGSMDHLTCRVDELGAQAPVTRGSQEKHGEEGMPDGTKKSVGRSGTCRIPPSLGRGYRRPGWWTPRPQLGTDGYSTCAAP